MSSFTSWYSRKGYGYKNKNFKILDMPLLGDTSSLFSSLSLSYKNNLMINSISRMFNSIVGKSPNTKVTESIIEYVFPNIKTDGTDFDDCKGRVINKNNPSRSLEMLTNLYVLDKIDCCDLCSARLDSAESIFNKYLEQQKGEVEFSIFDYIYIPKVDIERNHLEIMDRIGYFLKDFLNDKSYKEPKGKRKIDLRAICHLCYSHLNIAQEDSMLYGTLSIPNKTKDDEPIKHNYNILYYIYNNVLSSGRSHLHEMFISEYSKILENDIFMYPSRDSFDGMEKFKNEIREKLSIKANLLIQHDFDNSLDMYLKELDKKIENTPLYFKYLYFIPFLNMECAERNIKFNRGIDKDRIAKIQYIYKYWSGNRVDS